MLVEKHQQNLRSGSLIRSETLRLTCSKIALRTEISGISTEARLVLKHLLCFCGNNLL